MNTQRKRHPLQLSGLARVPAVLIVGILHTACLRAQSINYGLTPAGLKLPVATLAKAWVIPRIQLDLGNAKWAVYYYLRYLLLTILYGMEHTPIYLMVPNKKVVR